MDWNEPGKKATSFNYQGMGGGLSKDEFNQLRENAYAFIIDEMVPWLYGKMQDKITDKKSGMLFSLVAPMAASALCLMYAKMFSKNNQVSSTAAGLCAMGIFDLETTINGLVQDIDNQGMKDIFKFKKKAQMAQSIANDVKAGMSKEEYLNKYTRELDQLYDDAKNLKGPML